MRFFSYLWLASWRLRLVLDTIGPCELVFIFTWEVKLLLDRSDRLWILVWPILLEQYGSAWQFGQAWILWPSFFHPKHVMVISCLICLLESLVFLSTWAEHMKAQWLISEHLKYLICFRTFFPFSCFFVMRRLVFLLRGGSSDGCSQLKLVHHVITVILSWLWKLPRWGGE
jgi:hypothetical protein